MHLPQSNAVGTAPRRSVIFDLDGTLVDSLLGIELSARTAITKVLPHVAIPNLRALIGPPIAAMLKSVWPDLAPHTMDLLLAEFRTHYLAQGCLGSSPFPGVSETLCRLQRAGWDLFVLTNKPSAPATKILAHFGLTQFFIETLTPDCLSGPFGSKPEGARILMERFGLNPAATTLVGDGADDASSAAACGFRFIAAAYGYGTAATTAPLQIETFSELERLLL